jgi:hypothetical protein
MSNEGVSDFTSANNDFELLDRIRVRYQVFANDIKSLSGILLGFSLAKEDYKSEILDFSKYLTDLKNVNPYAMSWMDIISKEAKNSEYEIPIFFKYLDDYRQTDLEVLGTVELSWEQRDFDFRRRIEKVNIDFPELPLKAPHKLEALKIPGVKVHAFFYNENGEKYYEQCLRDFDSLKEWAKDCFGIGEQQWK